MGRLKQNILTRIASYELVFDLILEIIVRILRFPETKAKSLREPIEDCGISDHRFRTSPSDSIFGNQNPANLFCATIEQRLERGADGTLMFYAEPVECRERLVVSDDRFVGRLEGENRHRRGISSFDHSSHFHKSFTLAAKLLPTHLPKITSHRLHHP